ncbi:hypothetical protein FOVG_09860 [Fusarium oxysporum f. sp. pisi HDV247]|uniref:Uncharacterized protein n=1 Tax=Fusarium oxysporum f. sp. pisi HDV247 TaxID=1080344 RepID=W9P8H8_FUSOX|nr:hypothetical protein FOVG_09860 [Fusarium oxysporum f. sp. pisi HDV247]
MSETPLDINSFTFIDVNISKQAPVTPDDGDGIEALFNMRPLRLGSDDTLRRWDFNTSSVSTERQVKNRITANTRIGTNTR